MWLYGILGFIAVVFLYKFFFINIIVYEHEKGLLYRKGKFIKILNSGLYPNTIVAAKKEEKENKDKKV